MSDIVSEVEIDLTDPSVVDRLLDNPDLRKLPVGSDAFKAAAKETLAKMDETTSESAVTEEDTESVENADESEDSEDPETNQEVKPKKTRGMLKRIETLVAEREQLKRQLQEVEAQRVQQPAPAQELTSEFDKPKPAFKDFKTIEEYTEALTDWKIEKREAEKQFALQQEEISKTVKKIATSWEQQEKNIKKQIADYDQVVNLNNVQAISPSDEAKVYLSEVDNGPLVLYKLMSDDSLLDKFIDASPVKQVAMLAKIEAQLDTANDQTASKKTTLTRAPEPVKSLPKGKATINNKDIYNPNLSFEEYNRIMDERERAKKGKISR